MHRCALSAALVLLIAAPAWAQTAANPSTPQTSQRERMKACNTQAKTQALKGAERKTFLSSCLSGTAGSATTPTAAAPASRTTAAPTPTARTAPPTATRPTPAAPPTTAGSAVFPSAISSKFSSESAGKARMHTCLEQYNANNYKATNANGGLNWIAKGGGYYSECNKRLKG
jgi:hypothetical protein